VKAIMRAVSGPDVDDYQPADPGDVGFLLTLYVGPADGPGEESFDLIVCTPRWLTRKARERGPIAGRHHLIVESFDMAEVRDFLTRQVEQLEGSTWDELAEKIARIGRWEFADYTP
jgi:hypothetical protein